MIMVRAIVRPQQSDSILAGLLDAGYPSVTRVAVHGRGKQRGLKVGEITYDELPKELLLFVIPEKDKEYVINIILKLAKTGDKGNYGDGKVFVSPVEEVYTISSGIKEV